MHKHVHFIRIILQRESRDKQQLALRRVVVSFVLRVLSKRREVTVRHFSVPLFLTRHVFGRRRYFPKSAANLTPSEDLVMEKEFMETVVETVVTVALPASIGLGIVIATTVFIFWFGAGRQTSYEDAVKARQGHAEKELRKQAEREKEQKQKREKKRAGERKRRQEVLKQPRDVEVTPHLPPAQKSILKPSRPNNVNNVKVSPYPICGKYQLDDGGTFSHLVCKNGPAVAISHLCCCT